MMLRFLNCFKSGGPSYFYNILSAAKRSTKLLVVKFSENKYRPAAINAIKSSTPDTIILYDYDNSKGFKRIRLFSISNFIVWSLMGISSYDLISNKPNNLKEDDEKMWEENEGNRELVKRLIIVAMVLGFFLVTSIWFYFLRSIKQIKLNKKTKVVTFQTYSFYPMIREFSVPLDNVSGVISRHTAKGHLPIKIKNKLFHFLIDLKGKFPNPILFDNSVGIKRDFARSTDA